MSASVRLTPAEWSLLLTVLYADQFDFSLSLPEALLRQVSHSSQSTRLDATSALTSLTSGNLSHYLEFIPPWVVVKQRRHLVNHRPVRRLASQYKRQFAWHWWQQLPWWIAPGQVVAVLLTGSAAAHNASWQDDIDLMIVTQPGKLWTARLQLSLWTKMQGRLRTGQTHQLADTFCLNLWLAADQLTMPKHRQDWFTAYEMLQTQVIWDPDNWRSLWLVHNPWIKQFLPYWYQHQLKQLPLPVRTWHRRASNTVEKWARRWQWHHMQPKQTQEEIGPDQAFFHPHDIRRQIKLAISAKIDQLGLNYDIDHLFADQPTESQGQQQADPQRN